MNAEEKALAAKINEMMTARTMECTIDYAGMLDQVPSEQLPDLRIHSENAAMTDLARGIVRYFNDNRKDVIQHEREIGFCRARAVVLTQDAFWALMTEIVDMIRDRTEEVIKQRMEAQDGES